MKRFFIAILLLLILFINFSNITFAKKKKPKLEMPDAPIDFSAEMPKSFDLNVTRSYEEPIQGITRNRSAKKPLSNVEFISPNNAKAYESDVQIEWNSPKCSGKEPCTIYIKNIKDNLITKKNVIENSFLIKLKSLKLEPGKYYKVLIDQKTEELDFELSNVTNSPVELKFYLLSESEKKHLKKSLYNLKSKKDYYEGYSELMLFVDTGIWYDSVAMLNKILSQNPNEKQLINYKKHLYTYIKK